MPGSQCLKITNNGPGTAIHGDGSPGVYGTTVSGNGVTGLSTGSGSGVYGVTTGTGSGLLGYSSGGFGLYAATGATNSAGVQGFASSSDGVQGRSSSAAHSGVAGFNSANNGIGVYGNVPTAGAGSAIYGDANNSGTAWAGFFRGRVSALSYTTSSDARLKKDIQGLPYGTDVLGKLRPVTYHWKEADRGSRKQLGLIAQEVQKVIPELVEMDAKSGMLSVNYQALIPVMIKSLQEQEAMIKKQEERIAALEKLQAPPYASSMGMVTLGLLPLGALAAWRRRRA